MKDSPIMKLEIKKAENGKTEIWLDDKKIRCWTDYRIKSSVFPGKAVLLIELLVDYPVIQGNA